MALNNRIVVDLISDDEDESRLQPVANRNNFLPTTAASSSRQPSSPVTFNGLHDPSEFPNRANTLSRAGVSQYGSAPLGPPRQSSVHPSSRVNGVSKRSALDYPAIQPAVTYRDENTGIAVSGSRGSNAMNAGVKRRKLEIAKPQALSNIGRISSAPIFPPTITNSSEHIPLPIAPRMSNATQAILPAGTSKPTIITSALRATAGSPRVLSDGRGMELPGGMPSAMEPEMKRVLEQQVLPHVYAAVRLYRETLTYAERTEIGQTAASKLVTILGLKAHYIKNNKTMTPAFESKVKLNAYHFVNQGVEKVVKQRLLEEDANSAAKQTSPSQNNAMVNYRSSLKSSAETSENGLSPPSEDFEQTSLIKKRRRAISVSTATSYSNDHTDAETSKQNGSADTYHGRSRRAAAQLPRGTYQLKRRPRRSAAEMALVRGTDQEDLDGHVGRAIQVAPSPAAAQPVKSAPTQQATSFKPKRRRRTKLQMKEAHRLEAQNSGLARTHSRPRAQNDSTIANTFQAPALARDNVARPYIQQPVSQPIRYLGPAVAPSDDDHLKQPYISFVVWRKLKRNLSNPAIVKLFSKAELDRLKTAALHVPFSQEDSSCDDPAQASSRAYCPTCSI
ncbi:hypothetical protein IFR05_016526 [Cadophora sp. M221]|nr:hypothetical protein IFR05_016526 [Cadophora sp. M221]